MRANPHGGRTSAAVTGGVRVETGTCAPTAAGGSGGGGAVLERVCMSESWRRASLYQRVTPSEQTPPCMYVQFYKHSGQSDAAARRTRSIVPAVSLELLLVIDIYCLFLFSLNWKLEGLLYL